MGDGKPITGFQLFATLRRSTLVQCLHGQQIGDQYEHIKLLCCYHWGQVSRHGWLGGGAIKYLMLTRQIENNRPIGAVCDAQVEIVRDMSVTRRWNRWRITSDCRDLWIRSWNWKNTKADSLGAQNLPHHRTKKGHTIMHRAYGCKGLVEGKGFR